MAPTPANPNPPQPTTSPSTAVNSWSTAAIVGLSIFVFFVILFACTITGFLLHRRRERNKLPKSQRPASYRPYRVSSISKEGLLANDTPTTQRDRKSSMFSNDGQYSSVSLYAEHDTLDSRRSVETSTLIPLHESPDEDEHGADPMESATTSDGSGVSSVGGSGSRSSSRYSMSSSGGSLGMANIPIPTQEREYVTRPREARRMSSASSRYYEINTTLASEIPPVPKIVVSP